MEPSLGRRTIVWDLDDVLLGFTEAWLRFAWRIEHPECKKTFAELRSNPPLRDLGTSKAEYLASLDRFRLSAIARTLPPQPELLRWFERAGEGFRHAVLTARPTCAVGPGAEWVFTHFGRWIRDFHFVPSRRQGETLPRYEKSKAEVLSRLEPVDFLIDDSPVNVAAAQGLGIRAFLFPQPWNPDAAPISAILAQLEEGCRRTGRPRTAGRSRTASLTRPRPATR
jgi:hypothetical protein